MITMKLWRNILVVTAAMLSLASCSSDPEYVDPEAHEKTLQLRERYTPLIAGIWHTEHNTEKVHYFELITFQTDGTLTGMRKWQKRQIVTIDGQERYTDWEDVQLPNGSFTGTWQLNWERDDSGVGHDRIILLANFDDASYGYVAYSSNVLFNLVGDDILRFSGLPFSNSDGWTEYQRADK